MKRYDEVELITCVNCGEEVPYMASVLDKGNYFCTTFCVGVFNERQENNERGRKK